MRRKSIGEVLRSVRESRGLTLLEMQRITQIQVKYLQALEYNDFAFIPDETYARIFLQRYAEALGLDSEILLEAYEVDGLVIYYDSDEEAFGDMLSRGKKGKRISNYLPLISLLLAACSILIFVTYIVHSRIKNQSTIEDNSSYKVVSQSTSQTSSSSSTISSSSTSSSTTSSTKSEVNLAVSGGGKNISVKATNITTPLDIRLSVTDVTSWISVSDTDLSNGVVLSSENKSVSTTLPNGLHQTTITLGVVQGVTIEIGGKKLNTSLLTAYTGTITLTIE